MSSGAPRAAIELKSVVVRFGDVDVLAELDVAVDYGEIACLVGLNGSGKSTALRCAAGMLKPDGGRVRVAETNPGKAGPRFWRDVVVLLGDEAWYPDLTVGEHLELFQHVHGDGPEGLPDRDELLTVLGLAERVNVVPAVLSSGQRQRLLLAAALCRPAKILMLDEPEQRLDVEIRDVLADLLVARAEAGAAVLLACHDQRLIDRLGATVYSLDRDWDEGAYDDDAYEDEGLEDPAQPGGDEE